MFISFEFIPVCITSVRLVSLSLVFFVMHVEDNTPCSAPFFFKTDLIGRC